MNGIDKEKTHIYRMFHSLSVWREVGKGDRPTDFFFFELLCSPNNSFQNYKLVSSYVLKISYMGLGRQLEGKAHEDLSLNAQKPRKAGRGVA